MSTIWNLLPALAAGVGLGAIYFGGLWLVVRQLPRIRRPAPVMLTSLVVRTAVVIGGFYLVMDGQWQRALACLAGFLIVRLTMSALLRPVEAEARAFDAWRDER